MITDEDKSFSVKREREKQTSHVNPSKIITDLHVTLLLSIEYTLFYNIFLQDIIRQPLCKQVQYRNLHLLESYKKLTKALSTFDDTFNVCADLPRINPTHNTISNAKSALYSILLQGYIP